MSTLNMYAAHGASPSARAIAHPGHRVAVLTDPGHRAHSGSPSRTTGASRLRITHRGRSVLLALVALPVAAVLFALALNGGGATATLEAGEPLPVVVMESGQTLWSLAERIAPGADPRDVIEQIIVLNHLESADVWAGQSIIIPQQYSAGN